MLKKFSITIGIFFLLILAMGFIMPNDYEVKRSISINATPAQIHPWVEDLSKWPQWTPWQSVDHKVKIEMGKISKGKGATQKWTGKSGVGTLTITRSSTDYGIDFMLDMHATSLNTYSSITYTPNNAGTKVTWTTRGKFTMPVIGPYIAMAIDGTAGPMYEKGLKKLKQLVEESAR